MIARKPVTILCLLLISLIVSISGDFVTKSLSDKLTLQIQETQRLIVEEQEKMDEQKKLQDQTPAPVTVVEMPDGSKQMAVKLGVSLSIAADLSGEILRTYQLKLVDLKTMKGLYDMWNRAFKMLIEAEAALIIGLSLVLGTKQVFRSRATILNV